MVIFRSYVSLPEGTRGYPFRMEDLAWMTAFRAVNGIGLGIVQPLLFSLVADKSSVYGRGKAGLDGIWHGRDGERDFMGFIYGVCLSICGCI